MANKIHKSEGFVLQQAPLIYVTSLQGKWLLKHATPSWRIKDPKQGFQRSVNENRAKRIALGVLEKGHTFPNSIILTTDIKSFTLKEGCLELPEDINFYVVDGQHRLWAQNFSDYDASYSCVIHCGLSKVEMANLFLEINDTQKRVPLSLRWDLIRLVRPEENPFSVAAVDLTYYLTTNVDSPLYQRIDLTGEQKEISIKQGSLAPELEKIVKHAKIKELDFEGQYELLKKYFTAIKELGSSEEWSDATTPIYSARVLIAITRLMTEIVEKYNHNLEKITVDHFLSLLKKIKPASLTTEELKAKQGPAGISAIYKEMQKQVFIG